MVPGHDSRDERREVLPATMHHRLGALNRCVCHGRAAMPCYVDPVLSSMHLGSPTPSYTRDILFTPPALKAPRRCVPDDAHHEGYLVMCHFDIERHI